MQMIMPWLETRHGGTASHARVARGISAYASGHAAETRVAELYADRGCEILERRWRSPAGEVDLILRDGDAIVFVEVKKSGTHDLAAERLSRRQMDRICMAALLYTERFPTGSLTEMRFDAALVDGCGRVDIIENAFGAN
ncbi:YraN family protein [Paracoccus solventivorans]